jgi:CheY-like chemotaxis protein
MKSSTELPHVLLFGKPRVRSQKPVILVADDNELMRRYIHSILGETGEFDLLGASNGQEALNLIRTHHPDLGT